MGIDGGDVAREIRVAQCLCDVFAAFLAQLRA